MSQITSVSISPHFSAFIEAKLSEGRYASASEIVQDALQLLEAQESKLTTLRAALILGEESGVSGQSAGEIWAAVKERNGFGRG